MSFSLDTPSPTTLKAEAKALRDERAQAGTPLTQSEALEEVARRHGFRDWNTANAMLPERMAVPVQVGQRVEGAYLSQKFTGLVIGMKLLPDMRHFEVTVNFDKPVNVWKGELATMLRKRVTATIDHRGISKSHTSDGEPHMRVRKI